MGTMVGTGCTPIVSTRVRTGWKMGGVKDKYFKRENAGDQYVGRCASYLNQIEKEFAVTPPYFDFTHIGNEIDQIQTRERILSWLKERVLQHKKMSALKQIFKCLFVFICFYLLFKRKLLTYTQVILMMAFVFSLLSSIISVK